MPAIAQSTSAVDHLGANGNTQRHELGYTGGRSAVSMSTTPVNGMSPSDSMSNESRADSEDRVKAEQLDALASRLDVQKRIKEGAESMLQFALTDPNFKDELRVKVEAELDRARKEIETITSQMHSLSTKTTRKNSVEERDDFRTALNNAIGCIKTLSSLGRSPASQVSASPSTSTIKAAPSNEDDVDAARIETMNRLVGILQRNLRVRYAVPISEVVQAALLGLSDKCSKQCRACAYRLIRHALVDPESIMRLQEQPLDWYMIKSLARDSKHAVEKEQVVKLIRAIVEIGSTRRGPSGSSGSGSVPLSDGVLRAFVATAEQPDDLLKLICIETLAEILLIDIDLMSRTGGIRLLLHVLAEGPLEIAPILASTFLHVVDSPSTRVYLHPGTDFEIALSGVTDAYGKGPEHDERMRACARIITLLLRTWSGLMYFCMGDLLAIRTIIDTLRIPSLDSREIIIDMFFDLLDIKPPDWHQTFIDGRRLTMYRRPMPTTDLPPSPSSKKSQEPESLKLTDQYIALLILVFTKAGLLDALTSMFEESTTGSNLSRKATLLMAEVLQLANKLLPLSQAAKIQSLPRVFDLASDYGRGEHRIIGSLALSALDSFNRNVARLHPTANMKNNRPRANSGEDAVRRGQRQVEQVKIKMGMQMDDRTFQAALLETQVMLTKDHTKWNFETLQDLIEGPLLNPKRMEEAIKVSRFIRRLMSFFHPFSHRFSDMPRVKANQRWVKLGSTLLTTLLASTDGKRYLESEDDFLKQIVKSFAQLDPYNGTMESDPIFSKARIQDTLTYGYLEMLGTLSANEKGVELMEKFKIFTAFYHLSDTRSRDDLIKGIIQHLDYSIDGHSRIVLSKALTSCYVHIRTFATAHLGSLVRESATANAWTLRLLLTQLYDPAMEVCELAVQFLQEACESMEILRLVVEMQPTLDHLGDIGHPLLMKFMSTPVGFRYLYDAGYIDREIDMWFHERNVWYVVQIEVYLAKALNVSAVDNSADAARSASDVRVPRHFYGEMTKTELGCQVLQEKGHFAEFAHFIRQHGLESEDIDLIIKLKSILWAVGNMGATEGGLPFLEEEEIIPTILEIAEKSPVFSVRGTCFFVLGLLSVTPQGAEILDDYQWESTLSPAGYPTGLSVPTDLEKFIFVPTWDTPTSSTASQLIPPTSQNEMEVLTALHNLANTVIANQASRTLARLKTRSEYKDIFSSPSMFYRALHTISTHRYRLPVRRYVLDLFEIDLDYEVAKQLSHYAETLQAPDDTSTAAPSRVVSVLGIPGRARHGSESGEEDDLEEPQEPTIAAEPVMNLRPMSRIIGFQEK
ncbi:hypothetical protein OE88DRAFT_1807473 [Heliocybe sulcata]|uniref:REM-1 domain-containing protein n=1 Tax=Heliocybe sulcata TaxID=5364 RepID=A0A5C3N9E3_9AGAM|nr:hypothetical protein OE88DRAFT_1807473 [Heliocybe sulcata]